MNILERFINRKPRTTTVTFALDPNGADEHRRLKKRVDRTRARADLATGSGMDVVKISEEHDEAVAALERFEAESETITFHLSAIGAAKAEQLRLDHPPTKEQRTRAREGAKGNPNADPGWNDETFPPALVAASLTKITSSSGETVDGGDIDAARIRVMWDSANALSLGDQVHLFQAAFLLNQTPSSIDGPVEG